MRQAESGYLVLADISGFTEFVTTTELEHAPPIIAGLLESVIRHIAPPLEVQEVEGDAVFALGPDPSVTPPQRLLDVLDGAFLAFRVTQRQMMADNTCACHACQSMAALDLKIVAHHGIFLRHEVAGRGQVAGIDVILAHRLLKNHVERTGGYLLLTEAAVHSMAITPGSRGLHAHTETYDHVGKVKCFVARHALARVA